ncbi:hypothetical protein ILUMI_17632 [Ignelater luminosus]|uniref:Uncharacterized protein n=1 Tax=Ignelater luminosus TaxID=2038154 RepID=A0A8K0G7C2_IGNLU|nr:hypothetical protein ILUMI_17632 [Ignelater luminosus]
MLAIVEKFSHTGSVLCQRKGSPGNRIQIGQRLNVADKRRREIYCGPTSHIHLNGYINQQTTRFLRFVRLEIIVEKPLHSERVTIWCAMSGRGIIGLYFLEDKDEHPVTVNQKCYRENIIIPFLVLAEMRFLTCMQEFTPCYEQQQFGAGILGEHQIRPHVLPNCLNGHYFLNFLRNNLPISWKTFH